MNYSEFKDYLITHLWKMGDTVVIDALDTLITMANHELNRKLKIEDRDKLATLQATTNLVDVPTDYRSLIQLTAPLLGDMEYIIPAEWNRYKNYQGSLSRYYSVSENKIRLLGTIDPNFPIDLEFWYFCNVPDFQSTNASWVADDYLDVYTYCVLKHSAPFLREDERLPTWVNMYNDALASALEENGDRQFAGSPINIKMPVGIR